MTSRPSRRRRNEGVDNALEEIKQLKESGKSRLDEYENSEEDLYEEVEEKDFGNYVKNQRERGRRFIVSTDNSGDYVDDGLELWDQEPEFKETKPAKKSSQLSKKQQTRLSSLLLKGSGAPQIKKTKTDNIRKTVMSTDTLDSYLDDFEENPFDNSAPICPPKSVVTASIPFVAPTPVVVQPKTTPTESAPVHIDQEDHEMTESAENVDPQTNMIQEADTASKLAAAPKIPNKIVAHAPIGVKSKAPKKQPIRLEKQSDWFSMCDEDVESAPVDETMEEAEENSIPQSDETQTGKNFYFLDACYEHAIPGTVVLFGKYLNPKDSNKPESCCVRVQNLYRTLYILPRVFRGKKNIVPAVVDEEGNKTDSHEVWEENNEEPISIKEVCEEFNTIRKKFGIKEFRAKPVKRNYCFSLSHIPRGEHEYIKVQFKESAQTKKMSEFPLKGETFSHIFCLNQSLLERVILKQKIMGPQWISVSNSIEVDRKFSWCKHEWSIDDISNLNPISNQDAPATPPLVVLSLKVNTILNHGKQANEIIIASAMVHGSVKMDSPTTNWERSLTSFTALRKLDGIPWPMNFQQKIKAQRNNKRKLFLCETEVTLLNCLMNFISSVDPDVIVGHNYIGFDLDVLLHRMKANNISTWSRLGRLQRRHMPRLQSGAGGQRDSTWEERKISSGRLICDTYLASKELAMIRQSSYSLASLAKNQLNMVRYEVNQENLVEYFHQGFSKIAPGTNTGEVQFLDDCNLEFLIKHNENDTYLQLALMFKFQIIPLTKQLTNLSGNLWSRSLAGSRAERIAFYLLHEFHNRKYITPDKLGYQESTSRRKKAAYAGGLVLAPKRAFYDQLILLLDFNSLYPSLIQEYNICFTTLESNPKYDDEGNFLPLEELPSQETKGILPMVLKTLIERRKTVKNMIKGEKNPIKLQQLDIRQKALKLTANSMYGCLGFSASRFYAMPLAELVTRKGREALKLSKSIAEDKLGYDVVYGDTDSIMVATGTTDVPKAKEIATLIKKTINQKYTQLELDLDGIFKTMLLLKKKKYAALMLQPDGVSTVKETKGLDLVRRDWCPLSKQVGEKVLDFILSGEQIDDVLLSIHDYLRTVRENIYETPLEQFVITKSLSKEPEQYGKSTALPHVTVALALIKQGKSVRVGNHIPYVICESLDADENSSPLSAAQRAFHPKTVTKAGGVLEIDYHWYLENQILAPILRLCGPIEGTNPRRIAQCLGIEDSKLASRCSSNIRDDDRFFKPVSLDEFELYKECQPFMMRCNHCDTQFPFQSIVYNTKETNTSTEEATDAMLTGHTCTNEDCNMELEFSTVVSQLHLFIRKHVQQYYAGWLICDDPSCNHRTRTLYLKQSGMKCTIPHCGGKMEQEYSSSRLFNQICFTQMKFDITKFKSKASQDLKLCADAYLAFYAALSKVIEGYLAINAHNFVDCKDLFSCFSSLSIKEEKEKAQ